MALIVPRMVYPVTLFVQLLSIAFQRAGRPRLRVTSWQRPPEQQEQLVSQGRGVVNSLHLQGLAMDLQGADLIRPQTAENALLEAWQTLGLDAYRGLTPLRTDPEGPSLGRQTYYLHIELDGPALRRLGVDFRR